MEDKKTFGNYILQKRREVGLTQKGFAERLYVTESAVSKWERGVSYPDISLIKDICAVLGVSEHELLTASEDTQTRTNEKLANKYMQLLKRFKWAQIILYGLTLLTCFICNLVVQRTLSWVFIVLAAELLAASLTLLPVLVRKRKGLITLGGFTVSLLLLLLVCNLYSGGSWFLMAGVSVLFGLCVVFLPLVLANVWLPETLAAHKALLSMTADTLMFFALLMIASWYSRGGWFWSEGLPLAVFWLTIPWGMLLIIRYARINGFFKTAACLGLADLTFFLSDGFTAVILEGQAMRLGYKFDFTNWNTVETLDGNLRMLITLALLGLALAFAVAGIVAALRKNENKAASA